MLSFFLLVRPTGLEPVRPADTSTSSLPVCQFQHSRTYFFPTLEFYFSLSRLSMHFIKKFGVFLIDTGRQKLHNKQSTENCIWMRDSYLPAAKQKQRRRQMVVRKAISQDIDRIMEIYARAKIYMNENGNPGQWINGYPAKSLIEMCIRDRENLVQAAPTLM